VLGWTDDCREITERQSVVGARRMGSNRRIKLPSIGREGGSGDGFGRASSAVASLVHALVRAKEEEARRFTNGASADRRDGFQVGPSELVRRYLKSARESFCHSQALQVPNE
jgi:hypothetical protein